MVKACSKSVRHPDSCRQCDVEPDRITYSTLIKGYCVAGELEPAFKLFEELKADGKLDLDEIVPPKP